jgi:very-short-patch-repair endonuclease
MLDSVLRRLARDQWVRLHGTPRVTVLVGGERGREIWQRWLALSGAAGTLFSDEPAGTGGAAIDEQIRAAVARAVAEPAHPVAVLATEGAATRWRAGRRDRLAAMVDEGWTAVPEPAINPADAGPATQAPAEPGAVHNGDAAFDARSLAEATLFVALEATPATAGRFRLNQSLSVRFGPTAAEVDLLSRGDGIAIEIDGVHHFADPDCYRRDRRKDLLLQTHGLLVVRLLAEDVVRDVRAAVTVVSQALAYRLGQGRG